MDIFGFPYRIEMRCGTLYLEAYQEGIHLVPCQSNKFQIGKVRVKDLREVEKSQAPKPYQTDEIKLVDQ
jgi:hypothetical protein